MSMFINVVPIRVDKAWLPKSTGLDDDALTRLEQAHFEKLASIRDKKPHANAANTNVPTAHTEVMPTDDISDLDIDEPMDDDEGFGQGFIEDAFDELDDMSQ